MKEETLNSTHILAGCHGIMIVHYKHNNVKSIVPLEKYG